MKVKEIMVGKPASCTADTNLCAAVEILWNRNCGILPIVNAQQKVVGVVTDRDMCTALGTRNRLPAEITVGEVTTSKLFTCKPNEDIRAALATMAHAQVRRLPVIDGDGKLEGILSMDDVVLHSEPKITERAPELSYDDVVDTLKKLYRPELPRVTQQKTAAA